MSRYVNVNVDVDLSDIDTEDLYEELDDRNKRKPQEFPIKFDSPEKMVLHIKKVLGLQTWHKKERIIQEIENLF